ncbi:hypothetical protein GE09DRAFT_762148 [Coniochaeta sp. 2T2.1]|nr:hypothetical protein GE09DRAFT_762148 [Coniochaeta sp. 2T2.1]
MSSMKRIFTILFALAIASTAPETESEVGAAPLSNRGADVVDQSKSDEPHAASTPLSSEERVCVVPPSLPNIECCWSVSAADKALHSQILPPAGSGQQDSTICAPSTRLPESESEQFARLAGNGCGTAGNGIEMIDTESEWNIRHSSFLYQGIALQSYLQTLSHGKRVSCSSRT